MKKKLLVLLLLFTMSLIGYAGEKSKWKLAMTYDIDGITFEYYVQRKINKEIYNHKTYYRVWVHHAPADAELFFEDASLSLYEFDHNFSKYRILSETNYDGNEEIEWSCEYSADTKWNYIVPNTAIDFIANTTKSLLNTRPKK